MTPRDTDRRSPILACEALGHRALRLTRIGREGASGNTHWLVTEANGRAVLRRYRGTAALASVQYETEAITYLAARGWPSPRCVAGPLRLGQRWWALFEYLPGRRPAPRSEPARHREQRGRGRLIARLQADLRPFHAGQRPGWSCRHDALASPLAGGDVEHAVRRVEREAPEHGRTLRWYVERTLTCFEELGAADRPVQVVHGDVVAPNLKYRHGTLTGLLDFDLCHLDHRVADFVWTWRGRHDEVVHGFLEETPLGEDELELLVASYWASLIEWLPNQIERQGSLDSVPDLVARLNRRSDLSRATRIASITPSR